MRVDIYENTHQSGWKKNKLLHVLGTLVADPVTPRNPAANTL